MTTELEKQFFDTFGIEPKYYCSYHDCNCPIEDIGKFNKKCPKQAVTKECDARSKQVIYPEITDEHYLELICILTRNCYQIEIYNALTYQGTNEFTVNLIKEPSRYHSHSEDFKIALLKAIKMISDDENIKTEVQAIFEGER